MRNILTLIFSTFFYISSSAQQNNVGQKNDSVLEKVSSELCISFNKISDKSENFLEKILLRECLEESTEQNLKEVLKYYNVGTLNEINLGKYLEDLRPKISEKCKLRNEFISESFKTMSSK